MKVKWKQTKKQALAWKFLRDNKTIEILFGGGAGGGKSYFLCAAAIILCEQYEVIRCFIGRESLEDFKKSTMLTLFDIFRAWGYKEGIDYTHNQQDKVFHFIQSGSDLYYNELRYYPSDPNFDYLGSTEYTFSFIDEASQVKKRAKNTLRARTRYKLEVYGLTPKLVMTCNPDKGFLYSDFYKPSKNGKLPADRAFVPALVRDNKFIDKSYISNLIGLDDPIMKQRLLFGNWEYDDDPTKMISYDEINDLFSNIVTSGIEKYLICDAARFGKDRIVVGYFEGYVCKRIGVYRKKSTVETEKILNEWREKYSIPLSHTLVDEGGVGGGIVDHLGCKGFLGSRKAFNNENYSNLRSQCFYAFAKKVKLHEVAIVCENPEVRELIIEELEQVKTWEADRDKKLQVMPKDKVKEAIGRSPDFADMLSMRMFFDYSFAPSISWV